MRPPPAGARAEGDCKDGGETGDATGARVQCLAPQGTAPRVDGAADKAVVTLPAKALSLPKTSLAVVSGAAHRHKVVRIETDDPTGLAASIRTLIAPPHSHG